eukprot:jgi/Mesen1/3376/ME001918S02323
MDGFNVFANVLQLARLPP